MFFNVDKLLSDDKYIEFDPAFNTQGWLTIKQKPLKDIKIKKTPVGEIINDICKAKNFSQRIVLLALEREQTLVSKDPSQVTEKILNKAMGNGWTDGGTLDGYAGFETQIKGGILTYQAHFNKAILDEPLKVDHEKVWLANKKKHIWVPRNVVIPRNRITYSLYKYTPHIGDKRSPFYKSTGGAYGCYATYLIALKWFNWS